MSSGRLVLDDEVIFEGLSAAITLADDPTGQGVFLEVCAPETQSRLVIDLGRLPELCRFTVSHRYEPYWMKPIACTEVSQVPAETQFLLGQLSRGKYLLLVPLFGKPFRFSLRGRKDQHLELLGETGDSFTVGRGGLSLYVAVGEDPFELCRKGAVAVGARIGQGKLRREKAVPDFVEKFGWCTWDAFYSDVSLEKLRVGLESFHEGKITPKFVILDDGWQSVARRDTAETRLVSFAANDKFPGGLAPSVRAAKDEFAVEWFLVWHAMQGYWGGVDEQKLPGYGVVNQTRQFGEGILTHEPTCNQTWWGNVVGLVPPDAIARFYDEYHRSLAEQGVDGIKVDSQAVLEGVSQGLGGRVAVTMAYRAALEQSARRNFAGNLINCMSNAQETWYGSPDSTLIRSSIDFFPQNPSSHGQHLYTNAMMGVWFGEFMTPDWDMFQSAHHFGEYHAAARALSGGPVYCSDKPDGHRFEVLAKLVCSDSTVLRFEGPGYLTRDCLLRDPTREDMLLKIANRHTKAGINTGIVGAFFAQAGRDPGVKFSSVVRATDVEGLTGERFACLAHREGKLRVVSREQPITVTLGEAQYELFTYVPLDGDFAALGLANKFNSALAVIEVTSPTNQCREIRLRDGGQFVAYSKTSPSSASVDGEAQDMRFEKDTGLLSVQLKRAGQQILRLDW